MVFLLSIILFSVINLGFIGHPLRLLLFFFTCVISVVYGVSIYISMVMGVILFLTYVVGMLIIFTYCMALCPNFYPVKWEGALGKDIGFLFFGFFFFFVSLNGSNKVSLSENFQWSSEGLLSETWSVVMLMLTTLLFMVMVIVVNLVSKNSGALVKFEKK